MIHDKIVNFHSPYDTHLMHLKIACLDRLNYWCWTGIYILYVLMCTIEQRTSNNIKKWCYTYNIYDKVALMEKQGCLKSKCETGIYILYVLYLSALYSNERVQIYSYWAILTYNILKKVAPKECIYIYLYLF